MSLVFKSLKIEYDWNSRALVGQIRVAGDNGTIDLKVTPELTAKLVAVCADELVSCARETAQAMTAEMIEHAFPRAIES